MNFLNDILPLKNKLYRTALRITLNAQESEDIVQETLVKVWNKRNSWNDIKSMEAFSFTVCRNLSLDYIKKKSNKNLSLDDIDFVPSNPGADPLQRLAQQEDITKIERIINSLPEKQRTCMQLRDFEGLSYKQISAVLSISEEQVKINIFRARRTIREKILM